MCVSGDRVDAVLQAVERTAKIGTARVWLEAVTDARAIMDGPEMEPRPSPQPGLRGLLNRATSTAFRLVMRRLTAYASNPRQAIGFVDFNSRRSAIDYGAYAQIVDGEREWSGRSGRARATLSEEPARGVDPLWLFDLLRGVSEALQLGNETVRGSRCERLRATVDMARVSAARPGPTPLPPGSTFEELGAVPVEVSVDAEAFVRRIRFEYDLPMGGQTYSLELFDFGTNVSLDWSRLPVFKDYRTGEPIGSAAQVAAAGGLPSTQ